jgi:hypothetical protein
MPANIPVVGWMKAASLGTCMRWGNEIKFLSGRDILM